MKYIIIWIVMNCIALFNSLEYWLQSSASFQKAGSVFLHISNEYLNYDIMSKGIWQHN